MSRVATLRRAMAALAMITAGCASGTATPEPAVSPTTSNVAATTSSTEAPRSGDGAEVGACDAQKTAELAAVVEAQITALSRDDFAAARELATDAFRSQVSLEQFTMIIIGSYGFLLDGPDIVVTSCQGDATTVELQVDVYAREPVAMGYLLRRHGMDWAIDAAAVIGSVEGIRA